MGAAADMARRAATQRPAAMQPGLRLGRRRIRPILTGLGNRASFAASNQIFR
jgi:hypothetical protein